MGPTFLPSRGAPHQGRPASFKPNPDPRAHGSFVVFVSTGVFAVGLG